MIFSNNPEKLSLFGGGCNENDRILDLYGGLIVVLINPGPRRICACKQQYRGSCRRRRAAALPFTTVSSSCMSFGEFFLFGFSLRSYAIFSTSVRDYPRSDAIAQSVELR